MVVETELHIREHIKFLLLSVVYIFMPRGVQRTQLGRNRKQRNGRSAYDLGSDLSHSNFRSFHILEGGFTNANKAS